MCFFCKFLLKEDLNSDGRVADCRELLIKFVRGNASQFTLATMRQQA